jgi:hypothetical protein
MKTLYKIIEHNPHNGGGYKTLNTGFETEKEACEALFDMCSKESNSFGNATVFTKASCIKQFETFEPRDEEEPNIFVELAKEMEDEKEYILLPDLVPYGFTILMKKGDSSYSYDGINTYVEEYEEEDEE